MQSQPLSVFLVSSAGSAGGADGEFFGGIARVGLADFVAGEDAVDGVCGATHGVARCEAGMRAGGHLETIGFGQRKPVAQEALGAFEGIVLDQAYAVAPNFGPDIDLVADKNGPASGD